QDVAIHHQIIGDVGLEGRAESACAVLLCWLSRFSEVAALRVALQAGALAQAAPGSDVCGSLDSAIREDDALAGADRPGHVKLGLRVGYTQTELALSGESHLLAVLAAKEIAQAERERAASS